MPSIAPAIGGVNAGTVWQAAIGPGGGRLHIGSNDCADVLRFAGWLGARASLWIDDAHLSSGPRRGLARARRLVYLDAPLEWAPRMASDALYRLRQWCWCFQYLWAIAFGTWVSVPKSSLSGALVVRILGMTCDSARQCFQVPDGSDGGRDKRGEYLLLCDALLVGLAVGELDYTAAGRFCGVSMSFFEVIPRVRM